MSDDFQTFKAGMQSLNSYRFGVVSEILLKKKYKLSDADNNSYDAENEEHKRFEIKSSRAQRTFSKKITKKML